ncbi:hypothetical protein MMC10_004688 [Thelotrema lepadinum]|nr:hypothetical protein [Thelotrema lepadinum]
MSTATTGGQMINYSERFSLTGMTGAWQSQTIEDAWNSVKGDPSKVPAAQDQVTSNQNDPGAAGQGGPEYSVSYQFQTTGLTKYAPMQVHAPTAITKQDTAALFPTSLFIVAQTNLPVPSQLTTLTASRTYSYSTQVNSATPAPAPSNDMQKFLARWKD